MAKSSFEKALERQQKAIERENRKKMQADKKLADKQKREIDRQRRVEARQLQASTIVSGQPTYGGLRILDKTAEELISLIIKGHKGNDYSVSNRDVELPGYLEKNLELEFEKLKQYGMISRYAVYIVGCWEIDILPCLLTYFKDKEKAEMEQKANSNNFYGPVTGIQIQQGTINSTQNQTIHQEFDYEVVKNLLDQIKKYDALLESEFGNRASEVREQALQISEMVERKEDPNKLKIALKTFGNLVMNIGSGIIANGIFQMIQGVILF